LLDEAGDYAQAKHDLTALVLAPRYGLLEHCCLLYFF
jgi:hypothetical protein